MDKQKAVHLAGFLFSTMVSAMEHDDMTWEEAALAAGIATKGLAMKAVADGQADKATVAEQTMDAVAKGLSSTVMAKRVDDVEQIGGTYHDMQGQREH